MQEMHSPLVLWNYSMEQWALIYQVTSNNLFQLNATNTYTATFGKEVDISHICQFGWYQWIYFREQSATYPHMKECLGCCLGLAKNKGNTMAQWILKANGKVMPLPRWTCRHLTPTSWHHQMKLKCVSEPSLMHASRKNLVTCSSYLQKLWDSQIMHLIIPRMVILTLSHMKMMPNPLHMFQLHI